MRTNRLPLTKKQVFKIFRSKPFWLAVVDAVESMAGCHFKSLVAADSSIKTVGEWARSKEEDKRQQTSSLTVPFAYDFEAWIRKIAVEFGIEILQKDESEEGNDFRVRTSDAGIIPFEVKTTQCAQGWTGSTHSEGKGKALNYVLASFGLDLDYPITADLTQPALPGVITGIHASAFGEDTPVRWSGEASKNNSSTLGKIPASAFHQYRQAVAFGDVKKNRVWCKCERANLAEYRTLLQERAA